MIPLIFLAIIVCWVIGGQKGGRIRDVPVPILLGLGIWLTTKSWLVGVVSIGFFQAIRLGYGNYEKGEKNSFLGNLTHDHNGWWIRALYGLIVATIGAMGVKTGNYITLPIYLAYITGNTIIGFCVSRFRLPVLITDICVSAGFGSILFLI